MHDPEPMHIAFLIHELGPGGAERVMVNLANGLVERGHDVILHTLTAKVDSSFYPLDPRVRYWPLGINHLAYRKGLLWALCRGAWLVLGLRRCLRTQSLDVLVAFIDTTNIFALIASIGLRLPVIVSERSDPRLAPLRRVWKVARLLTYPRAAALVVQSDEVRNWFPPWIRRKSKVIPNPVPHPPESNIHPMRTGTSRRVIAVGRLGPEKGFDLLLAAFARLSPRFPDWNLEIWGEGPDRSSLEQLRARLGIEDKVRMPGTTLDIHARYAQADLFVLSSRCEGFPNVLCEAMSHGLPVVATSCSGGVRDILRPDVDGLLVPPEDPRALAEAMGCLMDNPSLRTALGKEARQVFRRFDLEQVLDAWEGCLRMVAKGLGSGNKRAGRKSD